MGKFSKEHEQESEYGKSPAVCGKTGCNEYTTIALAIAMRPNGTYISGPFTEVTKGNQFIDWVTRCSKCYSEDITRHRGIDYSPINIPSHEMTREQAEEARVHFLGMAKKFINGAGVRRNKANIESGKWTNEMESRFKQRAISIGIDI